MINDLGLHRTVALLSSLPKAAFCSAAPRRRYGQAHTIGSGATDCVAAQVGSTTVRDQHQLLVENTRYVGNCTV